MKTEYEDLSAAQEMLSDPDADPEGIPGLAAVLQESINDVLPLAEADACAWSLRDQVEMTGAPFVDLTGDAGPSGVKDEGEDKADGGATVKDEPLDFGVFDRYRRYR